jgi:hypothetical protein
MFHVNEKSDTPKFCNSKSEVLVISLTKNGGGCLVDDIITIITAKKKFL